MITNVPGRASRKRRAVSSGIQLYYDLARASGGQAIQVSKSDLSLATALIEDTSASAVVSARGAGRPGRRLHKYRKKKKNLHLLSCR